MERRLHFEIFPYLWLGSIAVISVVNLVWAYYEFRRGEARWGWFGARYTRTEDPFYYWLAVGGRLFGFFVGCGLFWSGLDMLNW